MPDPARGAAVAARIAAHAHAGGDEGKQGYEEAYAEERRTAGGLAADAARALIDALDSHDVPQQSRPLLYRLSYGGAESSVASSRCRARPRETSTAQLTVSLIRVETAAPRASRAETAKR